MGEQEIPPWLKEQLARFDQLQQNLQAILVQKQQVEAELMEVDRAITELKKLDPDGTVYKSAGTLFIKVNKDDQMRELGEKKDLANTRQMVLSKQPWEKAMAGSSS